jgi:16S rRNA (uracil1498-N3)-methyltransferase
MQFTYHINAGDNTISLSGDIHKYLFKVRRHNIDKNLFLRNLLDNYIYEYKIINVSRRDTSIELLNKEEKIILPSKDLHIGWCLIDIKNIEKVIASLNEIGVSKITFIKCKYSQYNIKLNIEKLNKLLINSSSQCGRSNIISLDLIDSLEEFKSLYPNSYMFNFSKNHIDNYKDDIKTIVLGCEGGFSQDEIDRFTNDKVVGIDSNMILRSETASITIASKILL